MKLNKLICFISVMTMAASFCGCTAYDLPDDMFGQAIQIINSDENHLSVTNIKGKYKKFARSCFEDIEVFGTKLTLPMNVSDLPDGFTIDDPLSPQMNFDGYKTERYDLKFEGVIAARAEVMYPANSSAEEGKIVTLEFSSAMLDPNDAFHMGGELGYLSIERANELLGECGKSDFMIYALDNNRVISFFYGFDVDVPSDNCAYEVVISTAGKTIG